MFPITYDLSQKFLFLEARIFAFGQSFIGFLNLIEPVLTIGPLKVEIFILGKVESFNASQGLVELVQIDQTNHFCLEGLLLSQ